MPVGRFIAGIGALIWGQANEKYLILKRADDKDYAPGIWECVTGRVDQGEGFEEALHREVREEIGVEIRPLFVVGTTHFYRGSRRPENELLGVIYCCSLDKPEAVRIGHEHSTFRWVTAAEAQQFLDGHQPGERWLKEVIARSELARSMLPDSLTAVHQEMGLSLD